ncbi:MAG: HAMP domain-containing sensor histidine kinase [Myxococcaceae bacterium]
MQRLLHLGPRLGFVLLVGALFAFEALFVSERTRTLQALAAEHELRNQRATDALHDELLSRLDVAEARIEALETLPLLEDDGLLWLRSGTQWLPRVPGVRPLARRDELARALGAALDGDAGALDAVLPGLGDDELVRRVKAGQGASAKLFLSWPWLERRAAAELCVQLQRRDPKDGAVREACQRGLAEGAVVPGVNAGAEPSLAVRDGAGWLVVKRGDDVRGAWVQLDEVLEPVKKRLQQRALFDEGDALTVDASGRLPALLLESRSLRSAEGATRTAFVWKTVLLTLTALLGVLVVWLARVAERREARTLALQREFIQTMSHELRTPLAAIRVMAETLERKLEAGASAKDYPRRLVSAADGLGFLVENILSFNRIAAGRVEPRLEAVSPSALKAVLEEDAALAVERPVQVRCVELEALPAVKADPALLKVLVLNLLRNAWKFARPEGPGATFEVRGRAEGDAVVLSFSDDGPGIPAEAHERVFEAFHRVSEAGPGGSGLGLALARRIAELFGGALRIAQSSAAGTTFELRLPRA